MKTMNKLHPNAFLSVKFNRSHKKIVIPILKQKLKALLTINLVPTLSTFGKYFRNSNYFSYVSYRQLERRISYSGKKVEVVLFYL